MAGQNRLKRLQSRQVITFLLMLILSSTSSAMNPSLMQATYDASKNELQLVFDVALSDASTNTSGAIGLSVDDGIVDSILIQTPWTYTTGSMADDDTLIVQIDSTKAATVEAWTGLSTALEIYIDSLVFSDGTMGNYLVDYATGNFLVSYVSTALINFNAGLPGIDTDPKWGDYDNDGDLDLLLVGYDGTAAGPHIFAYDLGSFAEVTTSGLPTWANSGDWADYDNDGDLDLALSGYDMAPVSGVYRNDGAGTFVDISATIDMIDGTVGWVDYDNDGDQDLILSGSMGTADSIRLYRNTGGAFSPVDVPFIAARNFEWGDYDNDGDLDIVLSGYVNSIATTKLYRNDNGTFIETGASFAALDGGCAWGDYDSDGDLDLVVTGYDGTNHLVKIYYFDGVDMWYELSQSITGVACRKPAWVDYDGDGDLDLILAGYDGMNRSSVVYANDGTGAFFEAGESLISMDGAAAWGDYDNDGDPDLVVSGYDGMNSVSVVYTNQSGSNTAPGMPAGLSATPGAGMVALSWTAGTDIETPTPALSYNIYIGSATGMDDVVRGYADPATGTRRISGMGNAGMNTAIDIGGLAAGTYYWGVQTIDNGYCASVFAAEQTFTITQGSSELTAGPTVPNITESVEWKDYDRDGDLDLLYIGYDGVSTQPHVYLYDMGAYTKVTTSGLPTSWGHNGSWADYDLDGDLDVVVTGYDMSAVAGVFRNDGSNMFTNINASIDSIEGPAYWADYDNDGDPDLLLCGNMGTGDSIRLYQNVAGEFNGVVVPFEPGRFVDWGDYDGDGDLDLVVSGYANSTNVTKVYRNDHGSFVDIGGPFAALDGGCAWGDFDSDGDLDLVVTGYDGAAHQVKIYRYDGSGMWTEISHSITGVSAYGPAWGDYDGNGTLDLALVGYDGVNRVSTVYNNDGTGVFSDAGQALTGLDGTAFWGDFEADGDLDLLISGYDGMSSVTELYRNGGGENTAPTSPSSLSATPGIGTVTLSWLGGSDTETPTGGLSYNIYIGTAVSMDDVVPASADISSGARYIVGPGNAGSGTTVEIGGLHAGTYYWSVQTIDNGYRGSAFAMEQSFTVETNDGFPPDNDMTLTATAVDTQRVALSWNPGMVDSLDADTVGIWWSTISAPDSAYDPDAVGFKLYDKTTVLDTVPGLTGGVTHFFGVTVRDTAGNWAVINEFSRDTVTLPSYLGPKWHVSASAISGGNGSAGAPFDSLSHAFAVASVGDTIRIASGTYPMNASIYCSTSKLFIQGGWSADFAVFDPPKNPVVFDGQNIPMGSLLEMGFNWYIGSIGFINVNGSALSIMYQDSVSIHECRFTNCTTGVSLSMTVGTKISNSVFSRNSRGLSAENGGGPLLLVNNTFVGNRIRAVEDMYSNILALNNIFAYNDTAFAQDGTSDSIAYNSFFHNGIAFRDSVGTNYDALGLNSLTEGFQNIEAQPGFKDTATGDYHLSFGSACVDAGDPSWDFSLEPGPNGSRINLGAYGNTPGATTSCTPPAISGTPSSQTVIEGDSVMLAVSANGDVSGFQWEVDSAGWIAIGGETAAKLEFIASAAESGYGYRCVISGPCGADTSAIATITVCTPPSITTHPGPVSVVEGDSVSFSVAASGTSLSYLWQVDTSGTWADLAGYKTSSLQFVGSAGADSLSYRCIVSGTCGNDTSLAALLTVCGPPMVTGHPVSVSAISADTVSFSISATGSGLGYEWQMDTSGVWVNVKSSTSSILSLVAGSDLDGALVRAVVTGSCGADTSDTAGLAVCDPIAVVTNPESQMVTENETVYFSVSAGGSGASYYWQQDSGAGWTRISGAESAEYSKTVAAIDSGTMYRAIVTGTCGNDTSSSAVLSVCVPPMLVTEPVDIFAIKGDTVSFSVEGTGSDLAYQWERDTGSGWFSITGEAAGTLHMVAGAANHGDSIRCILSGSCGVDTGSGAVLTVCFPPAFTIAPVSQSVLEGDSVQFSASAEGTDIVALQWERSDDNGTTWTNIAGATDAKFTFVADSAADGMLFRCNAANACGATSSESASLTVTAACVAVTVTSSPASVDLVAGDTAVFTVVAEGTGAAYEWQTDSSGVWTSAAGENGTTFRIPLMMEHDGIGVRTVVQGQCGTDTSQVAEILVCAPALVTKHPVKATVTEGDTVSFTIEATGTSLSYLWQKRFIDSSWTDFDKNTPQLILPATSFSDSGAAFRCIVTGKCGVDTSTEAVLTAYVPPVAAFSTFPVSGAAPLTVTFVDSSRGTIHSRQWDFGDGTVGDTSRSVHTYNQAGSYTVSLAVSGPAGTDTARVTGAVVVKDTTPPSHVNNLILSASACSTASVSWSKTTETDVESVLVCASYDMPVADPASSPIKRALGGETTEIILEGLKSSGAHLFVTVYVDDKAGNRSVGVLDSLKLPDCVAPKNVMSAQLSSRGDSAISASLSVTGDPGESIDMVLFMMSSADRAHESLRIPYGDTVVVIDGTVRQGFWTAKWALVDGGGNTSEWLSDSVEIKNTPPILSIPAADTLREDEMWSYRPDVFDLNNDNIELAVVGNIGFTIESGLLVWTPRNNDVGDRRITLIARDGRGGADTAQMNLRVENTNDAPIILSVSFPDTVLEDAASAGTVKATDIDPGDSLYLRGTGLEWLKIAGSRVDTITNVWYFDLAGIPLDADTGMQTIALTVVDMAGDTFSQKLSTYVVNTNDRPETRLVGRERAVGAVSFQYSASDDFDTTFLYLFDIRTMDGIQAVVTDTNTTGRFTAYPLPDGEYLAVCSAVDGDGLEDQTPSIDTFKIEGASSRVWQDSGVWQMISVPSRLDASSVKENAHLLHWDEALPSNGVYKHYIRTNAITELRPGMAYWRKADQPVTVRLSREQMNSKPVTVELSKAETGWNQISSPYSYPVRWPHGSLVWRWKDDIRDYEETDGVLWPWEGYWVEADSASAVIVDPAPVFPSKRLAKKAKTFFSDRKNWRVQLILTGDENRDEENIFGFSNDASDGFDDMDRREPPRPADDPYLFLYRGDWSNRQELAREIRRGFSGTEEFEICVMPGDRQVGSLSLTPRGLVGQSEIYLFLADKNGIQKMQEDSSVTIPRRSSASYYTVFATTNANFLANYPRKFAMRSPYPNPAGPVTHLEYTLPYRWMGDGRLDKSPYKVRMTIYDARGRVVRDLVNRKQKPGNYRVVWHGKSETGRVTAAGAYFCRLTAGDFVHVRPITVLK